MNEIEKARGRLVIAQLRMNRRRENEYMIWSEASIELRSAKYAFIRAHSKDGIINLGGCDVDTTVRKLLAL